MRQERGIEYRCDECRRNITDKKHVRILLGFTSGWMVPPFDGGAPQASLCDRNPEHHFCKPECFTLYFNKKLHEIGTNTARDVRRVDVAPVSERLLETASFEGPRMPREDYDGARDDTRWKEGERVVVAGPFMRVGTFSGRVPGPGGDGEEHQPMDSAESYHGLGFSRREVPADVVEAGPQVPAVPVRGIRFISAMISSILP